MASMFPTYDEARDTSSKSLDNLVNQSVAPETAPPSLGARATGFALTAMDEAAFGLGRPASTLLYGTANALPAIFDRATQPFTDSANAGPEGFDWMLKPYKDAYAEADAQFDKAREDIGVAGSLGASVIGNVSPMGILGRAVDKGLQGTKSLYESLAPIKNAAWRRLGTNLATGGTSAALQGYLQGEQSFEDVFFNGTFGAIFGAGMQKVMGDNLLIADEAMMGPFGAVMKEFADNGINLSKNLNLGAIAKSIDEGKLLMPVNEDGDLGGILTTQLGNAPLYRQWAKFNDIVADIAFGNVDPTKLSLEDVKAHEEVFTAAQTAVVEASNTVNDAARKSFTTALNAPASRKAYMVDNNSARKEASAIMTRLTATKATPDNPNPLGARTISTTEFLDDIELGLVNQNNRRDFIEVPAAAKKMYNKFNDLLRGEKQESIARDIVKTPVGDNTRVDEIFPRMPMAQFMDARAQWSAQLSPAMAFQNGTTPAEHRAGLEILRQMDDAIDAFTEGQAGLARGAYAKTKRVEEAFDMGYAAYRDRMADVHDKEAYTQFYGDTMRNMLESMKDPDEVAALRAGMKLAMREGVGRRGFLEEMTHFVGSPDIDLKTGDFFKGKGSNYSLMEDMLGQEDMNKILKLYQEGAFTDQYSKLLRATLEAKGMDTKEAVKLSGAGKGMLTVDKEKSWFNKLPLISRAKKLVKPSDKAKAEAAIELLTAKGEYLEQLLSIGVEQAAGGFPIYVGTRSGLSAAEAAASLAYTRDLAGDTVAAASQEIEDYLTNLGVSLRDKED